MSLFSFALKASAAGSYNSQPPEPPVEPNTVNLTTADFEYTIWDQPETNFNNRSALDVTKFSTSGTDITIGLYTDIDSVAFKDEMKVSIWDSTWNFVQVLAPTKTVNKQTFQVTLPSSGTYYITEGGNVKDGTNPEFASVSLVEITGENLAIETIPINDNIVINEGDSISIGDGSTNNSRYGYMVILRRLMTSYDFICGGIGGQSAYFQYGNTTLRNNAITRFKSEFDRRTGRKIILITLGTNDYGLGITLPNFESAVSAMLDLINTEIPEAEVIIVSPLIRDDEVGTNGNNHPVTGDPLELDDFRQVLSDLASTRPWVTYYEGKNLRTLPDDFAADGLHLNNSGNANFAGDLQTILTT